MKLFHLVMLDDELRPQRVVIFRGENLHEAVREAFRLFGHSPHHVHEVRR